MVLRVDVQLLLGEDVSPHVLHIVPILDDSVLNGIGEGENTLVGLSLDSIDPNGGKE